MCCLQGNCLFLLDACVLFRKIALHLKNYLAALVHIAKELEQKYPQSTSIQRVSDTTFIVSKFNYSCLVQKRFSLGLIKSGDN